MVASFSNAWPQGRDVISTVTPGLAASNWSTMPCRTSVRCGLVITSTSCRVVWAWAGHASAKRRRRPAPSAPVNHASRASSSCLCAPMPGADRTTDPRDLPDQCAAGSWPATRRRSASGLAGPFCTRPAAAGNTRLSWPPQLTPSLNRASASQNRAMPAWSRSSSKLNRPAAPESVAAPGPGSPSSGWWTRRTCGCAASRRAIASPLS